MRIAVLHDRPHDSVSEVQHDSVLSLGAPPAVRTQVIAGRKTQGFIEGEILVNGHPKVQATWARSIGYVEQTGMTY